MRLVSSTARVLQKPKLEITSAKKLLWNDIIKVLLNYYNLDYVKENVYISYIFINKDIWNLKLLDNYLGERLRQNKMAESSQKYAFNIRSHTDTYTGFYYRTAKSLSV